MLDTHVTRRRFVVGSGAVGCGLAALSVASGAEAASLDHALDAYFAPYVAAKDFAGVVSITRGGRRLARRAYGQARLDGSAPNRVGSKFGIQSISKLITEGTLYALEDQHVLSLSDPLARWLPDFPRAREVTLQMLLDHKSGLARDLSNFETERQHPRTLTQLLTLVAADGYVAEPGVSEIYSNNGYRVLAGVIERASGTSYHDTAARLVLAPRGMRQTGPMFGAPVAGLSQGLLVGAGPRTLRTPLQTDMSNEQGAASFYSTVDDLTRLIAHYPFRPQADAPEGRAHYGHNGLGNGYMSFTYRYPETETIISMVGNIESGLLNPVQADIEAIAFGEPTHAPIAPTETPVAVDTLTPYVGHYSIGPGRSMAVSVVDGRLAVNAGDGFSALWAIGADRFFSRQRYATLAFVHEGAGISRIDWSESGQTFPCPRVDN